MVAKKADDPVTLSTLAAVRRFNKAFDRHDVDGVMAAMTEDCVFENTCPRRSFHDGGDLRREGPVCGPLAVRLDRQGGIARTYPRSGPLPRTRREGGREARLRQGVTIHGNRDSTSFLSA